MTRCIRCVVRGRVQGVWYRASTQSQARRLGLSGHAHNLSDGSVEVLACGKDEALESLRKWLWEGPPAAQVSEVECHEIEKSDSPTGFGTG